jgi:hypothetical protein
MSGDLANRLIRQAEALEENAKELRAISASLKGIKPANSVKITGGPYDGHSGTFLEKHTSPSGGVISVLLEDGFTNVDVLEENIIFL